MSEQLYSIKETTLTDIGDALRRKHGETKIVDELKDTKISKTKNAISHGVFETNEFAYGTNREIITIDGADKIKVKISCFLTKYVVNQYVKIAAGTYEGSVTIPETVATIIYPEDGQDIQEFEFIGSSITIEYYGALEKQGGYYAECFGYGDKEVPNTYSSAEVAQAIDDIDVGIKLPDGALIISGAAHYRFAYGHWNWFVKEYGDRITTKDITNANAMFNSSSIGDIPFVINFADKEGNDLSYMFGSCNLKDTLPKIYVPNAHKTNISSMLTGNTYLRDANGLFANEEEWGASWQSFENTAQFGGHYCSSIFGSCSSMRTIPTWFYKLKLNPNSTFYPYTSNSIYYGMTNGMSALDEIRDIPVWKCKGYCTTNMFSTTANNTHRLKEYIFETNTDGTPIITEWKSQIIDFSSTQIGWASSKYSIINTNSGITADKEVKDDATYQALKDDSDWFTVNIAYSRYNHDSAVNTINSLPDTSEYLASAGGTNTIKFKGNAGSLTDGGAINTLTAEEIAVATAKGWTVTLV